MNFINNSKILMLAGMVMVFSGLMFFPAEVEAKKFALGTHNTEIGSDKVCGIKLCIVPLTIEEKVSSFLIKNVPGGGDQQIGRFSEGGVSQQSAGMYMGTPVTKSSGTYLPATGSPNVCGDKICDEPLSIEEKIAEFLESKQMRAGGSDQQGRFAEGGVFLN